MLTVEKKRNLKEEINQSVEIISSKGKEKLIGNVLFDLSNPYDLLYSFSTEDLRGYYSSFGQPKTFLTVGASGDQVLNAVKLGAKQIDVFDYNKLVKRQIALKIAAVKILNPESLYSYFCSLDEEIFGRLIKELSEEDRIYWESLYDYVGSDALRFLFYSKLSKESIFQINSYLDEDGYSKLQKSLNDVEINYYETDLYHLPELLKSKQYDAINLSNIYEYLNYGKDTSPEGAMQYYQFIMNKMYPYLNQNGTMMVAYMYAFNDNVKENFDEMYAAYGRDFATSLLSSFKEIEYCLKGFTSQNYSYSLLLDLFQNESIEKILTNHTQYGQSIDMSHDMALCLKK